MIIGLVRHGETDFNQKGIIQGHIDNPLNQNGMAQVTRLANYLKENDAAWDILGYTPLKRAKESALILNEKLDIVNTFSYKPLIERDFGPYDAKSIELVKPLILLENYMEEGFEDNYALVDRIKSGLFDLESKYKESKVLFVCHSHVIKSALIAYDKTKYNFSDNYVSNSSIYYFNVENDKIIFLKKVDI